MKRHLTLGFREQDILNALDQLRRDTPFTRALLGQGDPDHACLEILLLMVPECQLPKHFLGQKTSVPFISSIHHAEENVKSRWLHKTAVEQGGWPATIVTTCLKQLENPELSDIIKALDDTLLTSGVPIISDEEVIAAKIERETEISALESIFEGTKIETEGATQILSIPLTSAGMKLYICFGRREQYPLGRSLPAMYVQSQEIPAFHRLHLLQRLLQKLQEKKQAGEPILLDAVYDLEAELEQIRISPPDMTAIMIQFQSPETAEHPTKESQKPNVEVVELSHRGKKKKPKKTDPRDNVQILTEFKQMQLTAEYMKLLQSRSVLPAAEARTDLINKMGSSQVIVVVGDTGPHASAYDPGQMLILCSRKWKNYTRFWFQPNFLMNC
jgi:hypothetical protein